MVSTKNKQPGRLRKSSCTSFKLKCVFSASLFPIRTYKTNLMLWCKSRRSFRALEKYALFSSLPLPPTGGGEGGGGIKSAQYVANRAKIGRQGKIRPKCNIFFIFFILCHGRRAEGVFYQSPSFLIVLSNNGIWMTPPPSFPWHLILSS